MAVLDMFIRLKLYFTGGLRNTDLVSLGQRLRCNLRQYGNERSHLYLCGALHRNGKFVTLLCSVVILADASEQAIVAALMPFEPYGKRSM